MKFSTQVKPISSLKSHAKEIAKDTREPTETLVLLKLLALGDHEIGQGQFRPAAEVFAEMDKDDLQRGLSSSGRQKPI